ncbi:class II glutamine amidotransferase [Rhodococcus ruber]|uniref:class II glutamine amidotransferase n=1 Tax=Rhodococcus TaxID=1827 RepID=UPI0020103A7D|nr:MULTISPECIES: class II glutamine amidotransferase [Rhodococcus]UQB73187.1 class II glutamine amidotransferase [Rhodococcus ruber]WML63096.1 class II glutamine amidotransferase [Rhodococcus sp. AH-ZY2]
MAYSGEPILVEDLLFKPEHSLIDQSLHSHLGATTTNGDGFGIGWYRIGSEPALFESIDPAWNNHNLREIAGQIRAPLLFAHVRASTGTQVQRSNCHPFRHGEWLWMHNGEILGFREIKRELMMAVDPSLYPDVAGTTDSEVLFFLALTFGLRDDPFTAVGRAVGMVEKVARDHGIDDPVQMTVATTAGDTIWVFRYSTEGRTRSLFYSTEVAKLRELHPEVEMFHRLGIDTRFVVSEPLRDLPGAWNEMPESSAAVVGPAGNDIRRFRPLEPV